MYEINMHNIFSVIKVFENYDIANNHSQLCTYLIKNAHMSVSKYLLNNINEFISVFINYYTKKFSDDEPTLIYIINHTELELKHKIEYIRRSSAKIKNILDIPDTSIWPVLLKEGAFKNTWKNLVIYYDKTERNAGTISQDLANAMSKATGIFVLKYKKLNDILTYSNANTFRENIIKSTLFDISTYEKILSAMAFVYKKFGILSLSCISNLV